MPVKKTACCCDCWFLVARDLAIILAVATPLSATGMFVAILCNHYL
ncbi:MAG: hypothetical protein HY369_01460 [Candidatus Aenigmarchaeota archaeon]|nr:hypothetical protein [Candidatus Aenigmarchaeota archaeon]